MSRRTFTADEIAKILKSQGVDEFADGLKAIQQATPGGLVWKIEREGLKGDPKFLKDAPAWELAELSAWLWEKVGPQFLDTAPDPAPRDPIEDDPRFQCRNTARGRLCSRKDLDPALAKTLEDLLTPGMATDQEKLETELTPENLKGENDEDVIPDDLRESTDPAKRELENLLTPSRLVDIIQNPGLARKLADGTATPKEKLEAELMPDRYVGEPEEEKTLEQQLVPDRFRTVVQDPAITKVVPAAAATAKAKADLESELTPDALREK